MSDIHPPEVASFLLPGDLMIGDRPAHVKTIVGSCLAIMIRFPRLGLAAIAHCLLPEAPAPVASLPRGEALRYVDTAIEIMIRELAEQVRLSRTWRSSCLEEPIAWTCPVMKSDTGIWRSPRRFSNDTGCES